MARFFNQVNSEVHQEDKKPNMIKKFGGKFKKAFTKQKQSLAQKLQETSVPNVQSETLAQPSSLEQKDEQPSKENKQDVASTQAGVDEGVLVSDTTSQKLASNASPEAAVTLLEVQSQDAPGQASPRDSVEATTSNPPQPTETSASEVSTSTSRDVLNTDRYKLPRSNSIPASPSTPRTGASSDTLNNTPTHSDTSFFPSLVKFRQAGEERKCSSGKCHKALVEYIEDEEKNIGNSDWAAIVEWTKVHHQAEVVNLKNDHAVVVEELKKERSKVRRLLEMKTREVKALKRDMIKLKESIEETTKDQEEKQPASNLQSTDESGAESVDQDEGGVILTQGNAASTIEVHDKRKKINYIPQQAEEAGRRMNTAKQGMRKPKVSKKGTTEEKPTFHEALMQKLIEDSTPDAQPEAEAGPSTATQKATAIGYPTRMPSKEVKELHVHKKALQALGVFISSMKIQAETREKEIKTLKEQNHFAQLEIGHCHAANACYRSELEDENPARTAHLDGLLKRKDEAFAELEGRAAECAEMLAEEQKQRAIENEYSAAEIRGMHKELAHRFKVIDTLTEGKAILKSQNDWVHEMFQGKIFQDDILEAFNRDYFAIQEDNALLIKTINERQCYFVDAEKQVAELKEEKIIDDHNAHAEYLKHRQTLQSLNGLTYINHQLNAKIEIQDDMREELRRDLKAQVEHQAADIHTIMQSSADDWLTQRQEAQERQIELLSSKLNEAYGVAHQWRLCALEQKDGFCPMNDFPEVGDFNAEETRWRLKEGERQVVNLQQVVREMDRERKEAERKEAERKEAERKEAERKEAERKEAERKEAERKEAERKEAERKEAERKEMEGQGKGKEIDGKGKGKEREGSEMEGNGKRKEIERKGNSKEKEVLEIGHDGSNWLKDRADAEKVREKYRWME